MIYGTVILCAAMATNLCNERTGYQALEYGEPFPSKTACQWTLVMKSPQIKLRAPNDTTRIICSGKYVKLDNGEDI